jgi:hypothetical protein
MLLSMLKTTRIPMYLTGVAKVKLVGMAVFVAGASCILFLYDPAHWNFYPPCPFHFLTNYYCPGCGSLRALHQLFHGNIMGALDLNPLMVLSLPFLGYSFLSDTIRMLRKDPGPKRYIPAFWIYLFLATVILFWILRNIPYYPFLWLAP